MTLSALQAQLLIGLLSFLGGSLISISVTYALFHSKLAYIKGQLESLLKLGDKLDETNVSVVILKEAMVKAQADLNHAHGKIRELQKAS